MIGADYPFLDILWTMLIFFAWIIWFWMLIVIFGDLFRRHDISGWGKTGWFILLIFLPFLGVFMYLISQSKGMAERQIKDVKAQQEAFDAYVRQTAASGGSAGEIAHAKQLLDSGAISQQEYETLKAKALS